MAIAPVVVKSVSELLDAVEAAEQELETSPLWFRGQSSDRYALRTSLHRASTEAAFERDLTQRFRSRAGIRFAQAPDYPDLAAWLTIMQHYGLPTRLLDWSRSPLVAAFFAIEKSLPPLKSAPVADAAIWILSPHALNLFEGGTEVTPSVSGGMCAPLIREAFFEDREEERRPKPLVLAAMASETDMRMFVQQGAFTIHTVPTPLDELEGASRYLRKLVIPKEVAAQVAQEVHRSGMRRGDLFPDLQNLAAEMVHSSGL